MSFNEGTSQRFKFNLNTHSINKDWNRFSQNILELLLQILDWGQHVSEISCKATKTMGFLRRNLALASRHTKEDAYKTLVRPQIEYAAPIWHPLYDIQIAQVEKMQRTAA